MVHNGRSQHFEKQRNDLNCQIISTCSLLLIVDYVAKRESGPKNHVPRTLGKSDFDPKWQSSSDRETVFTKDKIRQDELYS